MTSDAYDLVPYTDHAYAESHPDRLAVVARLNRFASSDIARARVLELGCGRGGNLLPMAAGMPDATFVGIDRARKQIDEAIEIARATRLRNVTFRAADFASLEEEGVFDYAIAHGVCSWITPDVRRALFRTMASALSARGVAYVSFNVLPGWYERLAARDWLRAFATPDTARASMAALDTVISPELAGYRSALGRVAARIAVTDASYVTHEYFAEEHHPQTIAELIDEAEAAGLRYLGDAIAQTTAFELAPNALAARVEHASSREAQLLLDFSRNTAFRRALFVRADTCDAEHWRWSKSLDANALASMRITSRLKPTHHEGELVCGDTVVQVGAHGRDALREIARAAPHAAPIDVAWREELFDLWLATDALDLHVHTPALADGSAERPLACAVARWHAVHGGAITNRWHHEIVLDDELARAVLARLDGTKSIADIARELVAHDAPNDPDAESAVRGIVSMLASLSLIVPNGSST